MIPPLDDNGVLLPGIHEAEDWEEIVRCFGGTPKRDELLSKLRRGLNHLREVGCPWVLLGGSFVTDREEPADVDGCWQYEPAVNLDRLEPCFGPLYLTLEESVSSARHQLDSFGMDFYPAQSRSRETGKLMPDHFQESKDGQPRGIVRLDLRTDQGSQLIGEGD